MAIYSGRILARRGANSEFDPDKMLAGEWAVTTDENTRYIYMCFEPGVVKRVATYEDFLDQIDKDTATIQTLLDTLHLNIDSLETLLVDRLAINDGAVSTTQGWSSNKINTELDKINTEMEEAVDKINTDIEEIVDDTTKSTDKAYSNSHMDTLLASLKATIKAEMEAEQNAKKYPIGAVVMGDCWDTEAKVKAAFGGTTWVQLEQGRAIISAGEDYESGSNYGSNSITLQTENLPSHNHTYTQATAVQGHTLTVNEIPSHTHKFGYMCGSNNVDGNAPYAAGKAMGHAPDNQYIETSSTGGGATHSHDLTTSTKSTSSVGSASPITIEPKSVAFYMWQRTA